MKGLSTFSEDEEYTYDDEKLILQTEQKEPVRRHWIRWLSLFLSTILFIGLSGGWWLSFQQDNHPFSNDRDQVLGGNHSKTHEPLEVFELTLPILHKNKVHQDKILTSETFGNSWGKPAIAKIVPPKDIEFNRVVLNLNVSVSGIQYDRLAHIFIDDIPIWRTSTPEPGNEEVYSCNRKDISKYLPLFKRDELELVFQLDNRITRKLTGVFNVSLSVSYYNEDLSNDENDEVASIFKITNRPAHKVSKLIEPSPNRTPLIYLSGKGLSLDMPRIEQNTTNLKLALFASGNAAEEFWFSNILDEYKDKFSSNGHELLGHGPVRVVHVYINDILVSSIAPEPVIYSGGLSPALWKPIIGINAFDIKPLEFDLTAFLPELWTDTGAQLRVEITNGQDTEPLKIGENWIVSACLLHWESPKIESAVGSILSYSNASDYRPFGYSAGPDNLFQSVYASASAETVSNITFNLFNKTQLPLLFHTDSAAKFSNYQLYESYGDTQFLSSLISTGFRSKISLGKDIIVNKLVTSKVHPQVISIAEDPLTAPNGNLTYDVNITTIYGANVNLGGKEVFTLENVHNGTSTYTLTPFGNHGFGSGYRNFAADLRSPFPKLRIDQMAEAVNGTVIRREDGVSSYRYALFDLKDQGIAEILEHLDQLKQEGAIDHKLSNQYVRAMLESLENSENIRKSTGVRSAGDGIPRINIGSRILI